jgi:hypothetical protein
MGLLPTTNIWNDGEMPSVFFSLIALAGIIGLVAGCIVRFHHLIFPPTHPEIYVIFQWLGLSAFFSWCALWLFRGTWCYD